MIPMPHKYVSCLSLRHSTKSGVPPKAMRRVGIARLVRRKEIRVELVVYLHHLLAGEVVEGRMTMTLTDPRT